MLSDAEKTDGGKAEEKTLEWRSRSGSRCLGIAVGTAVIPIRPIPAVNSTQPGYRSAKRLCKNWFPFWFGSGV